ncbi:hypothetical protein NDU88_006624 [Pleurodeles waltl]|uniref:Uncharacterized protein n=1 Tax=Pleurodeles waltl TaxID=8319 RepID=A0AAV7RQQ7_PLEWA|nr:hypothetical protein NDU88_006624 [Pleurodeles waltl]
MTLQTATVSGLVPTPSKAWRKHITEDKRLTNRDTEKTNAAMDPEQQIFPSTSTPCSTWNTNADEDDDSEYSHLALKEVREEKKSDTHMHDKHQTHTHYTENQLQM